MIKGVFLPEERQLFLAMRQLNQSCAENALLGGANINCIAKVTSDPDSLKIMPIDILIKTLLELEDELHTVVLLCQNPETTKLGQIEMAFLLQKKNQGIALLKWMLEKDANPEGGGLSSPLHHAVSNGIYDPAIVSLLLMHDANPKAREQDFSGNTPLHLMCGGLYILARNYKVPSTTVLDLLVKAGADVNAKDQKGRTPARMLTLVLNRPEYYAQRVELLKALVQRGADLTICDDKGISALSFITEHIEDFRQIQASPCYVPRPCYTPNMSMMQSMMTMPSSKVQPTTVDAPSSPLPRRKSSLMKQS